MNDFISFCDYADDLIIDGEASEILNMPEVGDIVVWIDPHKGQLHAKVAFFTEGKYETIVKLGRAAPYVNDNGLPIFSFNAEVRVVKNAVPRS